jgi:hypothetical protein
MEGILTSPPGRDPKELPLVVPPHGGPIGVRDSGRKMLSDIADGVGELGLFHPPSTSVLHHDNLIIT